MWLPPLLVGIALSGGLGMAMASSGRSPDTASSPCVAGTTTELERQGRCRRATDVRGGGAIIA